MTISIQDCRRFQEHLYGWELSLTLPVKEIYRGHRIRDDERLTGYENVRIWKERSGSEVRFMAPLMEKEGRKKYLEFNRSFSLILSFPSMLIMP